MKRYIKSSCNIRQNEYQQYLLNHIGGVKRAWNEILLPALLTESDITVEDLTLCAQRVEKHDESKYCSDEFDAYCNHFYPSENNKKDSKAFDEAWLLHQKRNPHHWQYWILIRDEGELVPMDMPFEYVCEMLCDWSSFHYVNPESTANNWYNKNKKNMILSDGTRKLVELLLSIAPEL